MPMSDELDASSLSPRNTVRLRVEPAEIALECADGPLPLCSVQSAFPLSSSIYFRAKTEQNSDCRIMLKFDGRRFFPPVEGWSDAVEYFVELGARHHPFPFASYGQAAKQFERSVNLVQQMMNGMNGAETGDREKERRKKSLERDDEWGREKAEADDTYKKNNDTTSSSRESAESNHCSSRDFADLARICAGKDAIIMGLRAEMDEMSAKLGEMGEKEAEWTKRAAEWTMQLENNDRELAMMRELGRDQHGQRRKVEQLEHSLTETKQEADKRVVELEETYNKCRKEAEELRERNEQNSSKARELTAQLQKCQREKTELRKKLAILEDQVNGEAMEFDRRFRERERIQKELMEDNGRLYRIKEQLEKECLSLKEKLRKAETETERKMQKK